MRALPPTNSVHPLTRAEWRAWLEQNHTQAEGGWLITFKKASARNVSATGDISKLVIQALRTIGKEKVSEEEIRFLQARLREEKPYHLQHDIKVAPEWIRQIMKPAQTPVSNE